jgi:glycosyltransferase involved in cell wall biosynthesis
VSAAAETATAQAPRQATRPALQPVLDETLVNGRYLTRPPTGVDRFAMELLGALAARRGPLEIAVPATQALHDRSGSAPGRLQPLGQRRGQAWEQTDLPRAAGDRVLLNLCNTAPLWRERQLVVIHDAATVANPANYGLAFRQWYRLMHGSLMRRARVVATVSAFSRDELLRHHGARRLGVEVLHEGGEHILRERADPSVLDRLGLAGQRYVLAVGSRSPNKNFQAVLEAVRALRDPGLWLVAAGGGDARIYARTELVDERLKTTGYVSDAQLRALYEHAACFAFPSYYEGFGLPPLEAMNCGCPVIVSDRASLPEVCGDAALYCKAEDPATLASALHRVLGSPSLRQELRDAGRARARQFGWDRAAAHFEQIVDASFH